jgi:hypothetical protein
VIYRLEAPDGTLVNLVDANTYLYGNNASFVTVTFDDSATQVVGGEPHSGAFRPVGSLAAFNGRRPFGNWTLHIGDATSQGTHCFSQFSLDINPPVSDDEADVDGDGLAGVNDNCPTVFNPRQEDGWGSAAGDACDTDWYNHSGKGLSAFVQKNGVMHLHGNCTYLTDGAPRCPIIAAINPSTFVPGADLAELTGADAGVWSVWLYYLYSENGVAVYQVNTYRSHTPQPDTLVDDELEIHISAGSWRWLHRGGAQPEMVSYYDLPQPGSGPAETPANKCLPSRLSWVSCAVGPGA